MMSTALIIGNYVFIEPAKPFGAQVTQF